MNFLTSKMKDLGTKMKEMKDERFGPKEKLPPIEVKSHRCGHLPCRGDGDSPNSWAPKPLLKSFELRAGPDYENQKRKEKSGPPYCELVGMDVVTLPKQKISNIGEHMLFPQEWTSDIDLSSLPAGVPPIIIVNAKVPTEVGVGNTLTTFWKDVTDGPGYSLVFYYRLTQATIDQMRNVESAPPSIRLLYRWLTEAPESHAGNQTDEDSAAGSTNTTKDEWAGRFKIIASIANIDEFSLPSFITQYNGRPVLIRSTGSVYRGANYVEQVINVHAFGLVGRQALGVLSSKFGSMFIDVGFCIESQQDEEMPENLLGYACLDRIDISSQPDFTETELDESPATSSNCKHVNMPSAIPPTEIPANAHLTEDLLDLGS